MKTTYLLPFLFSAFIIFSCSDDDGDTNNNNPVITQPPVANFNIENDNCVAPCTVNFTSTTIGEEVSLNWDFGDGGSAGTETSISRTYDTYGYYEVTLTALNAAGTDEEVKYVTILENPPVSNNYSKVFFPSSVTFTLLPFDLPTSGNHIITYNIKDDLGQSVASGDSYISQNDQLPLNFYFDNAIHSERIDQTFTLTLNNTTTGESGNFSFVPTDYPPDEFNNCGEHNIVQNGLGVLLPICWEN